MKSFNAGRNLQAEMDSGMWKLESFWHAVESECEVAALQHGAFLSATVALMAEL
jgi:hypothetical protein